MHFFKLAAKAFVIATALVLASCTIEPPQNDFAEITFTHRPIIKLDVASIVTETSYETSLSAPHVEHLMPLPLATAAHRWADDRLSAAGTSRTLRYVVTEASVIEEPLEVQDGLTGLFHIDQSERYRATLKVQIQILNAGRLEGELSAEAIRSITVPEDSSLKEREQVWYRLEEKILRDLDLELERAIDAYFAAFRVL